MKAIIFEPEICPICNSWRSLFGATDCSACLAAVGNPPQIGIGTKLAKLLKKLHLGKPGCISCQQREKKLNRFGAWLYYITIGWWNAPSKAKRRKQLLAQQNSIPLPLQEEMAAAKELRRQKLLLQQNLTSSVK